MEWISLLVTFVLGGGLMALFTIKPQKRKAEAEADQTKATANSTEIQNYSQIAKDWREYAQEAEKRYEAMTLLMQKQIASLTQDVDKLSKQLNQILKIIKEINHDNIEQKKQEAESVGRS
jgi:seryl-tRNA synthetase